ncbi:MAG: M48 family metallopeptidase [Anaerolineae bacterium]|nr:M48 family metallopeptidase [Anaerolineae bacterium]MBT7190635.1 M48 family metallopeptidase [Anaerolineae bacterium]MBT7992147.1 M48 family metallopeptidase [Anaerolineae bacterium]
MNPFLFFILTVLILQYLLDLVVDVLELRSLNPVLPNTFRDVYDEEKYASSQRYTRVQTRFGQARSSLSLIVTIGFILVGGFSTVDMVARRLGQGSIVTGLIFTGILFVLSSLFSLPFSVYFTFVIEERFGFNRTTLKIFILDLIKGTLLSVLLGAPLLAMLLWFFESTGEFAWLYSWIGLSLFTFVMQFLAPVLIMPLFNKFTPLEDGELKEKIIAYAQEQDFSLEGIYTMDGSKRSTRLNAFFTGFGRFRRIIFFDTLLEKLEDDEVVVVLAHEMGHFKRKHILKMMGTSLLQSGLMFFILSLFLGNEQLFAAFGMENISIYASLTFFLFLYAPISSLISIFFNIFSRKYEYEADVWAVETTGKGKALISGLQKLSVHNLSNLTPHPLNVFLNYSHPPVLERVREIEE